MIAEYTYHQPVVLSRSYEIFPNGDNNKSLPLQQNQENTYALHPKIGCVRPSGQILTKGIGQDFGGLTKMTTVLSLASEPPVVLV